MRKLDFCLCENKGADQLRSNCKADQHFVFATRIVQFLFFLNPNLQASNHLLWQHRLVCVRLDPNSRRPVFSHRGSYLNKGFKHQKTKQSFFTVGKQSPCTLSFVYTSYVRARVRTIHNFGNRALLFSY